MNRSSNRTHEVPEDSPNARHGPAGAPRVQSVQRAAEILRQVALSPNGLTTREIAQKVGITLQVTYHLIHTLSEARLIARNDRNRLVLGIGVGVLASGFRRHLSPPEYLLPLLRQLVSETSETSYATGWVDGEIVLLESVRGTRPVLAMEAEVGLSDAGHARSAGKVLLAQLKPQERRAYLVRKGMPKLTFNTITDIDKFESECGLIRERGYSIDLEERVQGIVGLAVPLVANPSLALAVSFPASRFESSLEPNLAALRKAAAGTVQ